MMDATLVRLVMCKFDLTIPKDKNNQVIRIKSFILKVKRKLTACCIIYKAMVSLEELCQLQFYTEKANRNNAMRVKSL
jgi:hypothetical protein